MRRVLFREGVISGWMGRGALIDGSMSFHALIDV